MILAAPRKSKAIMWVLTEYGQDHHHRTIIIPTREHALLVGRGSDADLTIPSTGVSKRHAHLTVHDDHLVVEDLGSTNGTYVNGKPVKCSLLVEGDLVQFANALYRVDVRGLAESEGTLEEGILPWAQTLIMFDRLLSQRAVVPHFQPIVTMESRQAMAFELLARSDLEGLVNPGLMFGAAERLGQQATLSELMREEGMRVVTATTHASTYFLNTHPCEVLNERFTDSLYELRRRFPQERIAIEVHESSVTDLQSIRKLRRVLAELDMQLSYDDFGAGQGRLMELGEIPPDVLKFDMQLIRGIDSATATRQELLAALVRLSKDLGTTPLAEGVETEAEHETCRQMGFELGQGFLYGRPQRW